MTDIQLMRRAADLAKNTQCWMGIGCVVAKNGEILSEAWNRTIEGETFCQEFRDMHQKKRHDIFCRCENKGCDREKLNLRAGRRIEISCSVHAEANAIAQAAKQEISVDGASIFVTSFPCIVCMRLIVAAGIKKVFYMNDFYRLHHLELFEKNRIAIEKIPQKEVWENEPDE